MMTAKKNALNLILKSFDKPDEIRRFEKGKFEVVEIGGLMIGRATYEPGWKWSVHVGQLAGTDLCSVEHVGFVFSGRATAAFKDGRVIELTPGNLFHIPPEPHDSWVLGDEQYVSLHFLGVERYTEYRAVDLPRNSNLKRKARFEIVPRTPLTHNQYTQSQPPGRSVRSRIPRSFPHGAES